MPANPITGIFTNVASRASGTEVEMTPLTAVDPEEENKWRHRFNKQLNLQLSRQFGNGEASRYYDPRSKFSPESAVPSLELPRKIRVVQKKRLSKWRLIFMIIFIISVLLNVAMITLFVYWYVRFKQIRTIWNQTFAAPTPTPSASPSL